MELKRTKLANGDWKVLGVRRRNLRGMMFLSGATVTGARAFERPRQRVRRGGNNGCSIEPRQAVSGLAGQGSIICYVSR
ncbi:hypothetical protein [Bradyrhizobium sp. USDA 4506]